jgi:uncharacterized protein (UPF0276 family)
MGHREPTVGGAIPASAGIGLRASHYRDVVATAPRIGWLEVHSENYFGAGGPPLYYLDKVRADYPVSLHGVGLSLGSADPLEEGYLARLKGLIERAQPGLVSDHLAWCSVDGRYLNDLLPVPYTEEVLAYVAERVARVQDYLGRRILIENPSSYLEYRRSTIPEWAFLAQLARRSGCGILLDINNLYVSAHNHGFDPHAYLRGIPAEAVEELHLAGHTVKPLKKGAVLIDSHDRPVAALVWTLFAAAVERFGTRPTLIEWDTDLPALSVLLDEAAKADRILESYHALAA